MSSNEIYVFHPGAGVNRASDGSLRTQEDGANTAYLQQRYVNGVNKRSFFQGAVVPPNSDSALDTTIKVIFRQISAGSGNIYVDVGFNNFNPPTNRDSPLTSIGPQAITMPGTVGQEVSKAFTITAGTLSSLEELIFYVERRGGDLVNDSFLGEVSLVRFDIQIPIQSVAGGNHVVFKPGGVTAGSVYTTWDEIDTAVGLIDGPVVVQIDDSLAPANIAGIFASYDLSKMIFIGKDPGSPTLTILSTTKLLTGLPACIGDGVVLANTMVTPAYTSTGGDRLTIEPFGAIAGNASAPLIDITGGTFNLQLYGSVLSINQSINIGAAGALDVTAYGGASAASGAVSSAIGGVYSAFMKSTAAVIDDQSGFGSFLGTFSRTLDNISSLDFYDNTTSGLTSSDVQGAIDELAAGVVVGQWTNAGSYLRPTLGSAHEVVIGDTVGPFANEKFRVRSTDALVDPDRGNIGTPAGRFEGDIVIADEATNYTGGAGAWNGPHLIMGDYHFWVDGSQLRMKSGAPTSSSDGEVVGAQGG